MMLQRSEVNEKVRYLSADELSEIITKCERAIAEGSAEIDDYEAFVLCQQELARRTWTHS
ncbi:MAG: hypothetical protein ACRCYY_11630 [Trueperaceae bacterium]